jgi:hypothetical protein
MYIQHPLFKINLRLHLIFQHLARCRIIILSGSNGNCNAEVVPYFDHCFVSNFVCNSNYIKNVFIKLGILIYVV